SAGVEFQAKFTGSGFERNSGNGDRLPVLPVAGVRDLDRGGNILAVDRDFESAPAVNRGDAEAEIVVAGGGDFDGVLEPFAGFDVADVESAAGVGGVFDIDLIREPELAALIEVDGIVVGDAGSAMVEAFGFDFSRNRGGRAAVGTFGWGRGGDVSDEIADVAIRALESGAVDDGLLIGNAVAVVVDGVGVGVVLFENENAGEVADDVVAHGEA